MGRQWSAEMGIEQARDRKTGRFVFHVLDVTSYSQAMTQTVRSLLWAFPEKV